MPAMSDWNCDPYALSRMVSQVNLTSAAVNSSPECHLTPCRSVITQCLPSSDIVYPVASEGTSVLSCQLRYSYSRS